MSPRPGVPRAVRLSALALAVVGCGDIRLIDPTAYEASLIGTYFALAVASEQGVERFGFRGYAYGLEGEQLTVRYLDAGEVRVAGRRATRWQPRTGEAEYLLDGELEGGTARIAIEVSGSKFVPACRFTLPVPVVALPEDGAFVSRHGDVVLPLDPAPDALPAGHRISARVRIAVGADGAAPQVDWESQAVRSELVIPRSVMALAPPGDGRLRVRLQWDQYGQGDRSACGPALTARTSFEAERRVRVF